MERTPSLDQTVESTVAFEQKTFLNLQHTLEIHWFDACGSIFFGGSNQATKQHHQVVGRLNSGILKLGQFFWTYRGGRIMKLEAVIATWKNTARSLNFAPRLTAMRITFPESCAIAVIPSQNTWASSIRKKTPGIFDSAPKRLVRGLSSCFTWDLTRNKIILNSPEFVPDAMSCPSLALHRTLVQPRMYEKPRHGGLYQGWGWVHIYNMVDVDVSQK